MEHYSIDWRDIKSNRPRKFRTLYRIFLRWQSIKTEQ